MRHWIWILLVLFLAAAPGSAECTRFISVENATGQEMSALWVTLVGTGATASAHVEVEPDADPVCPPPGVGGDLLGNIVFGWHVDCVDPGSTVTFQLFSSQDIPGVSGDGRWSNLADERFPIPAADFLVSPDCNSNCIDDGLDIAAGTSADADGDGVPDECRSVTDIPVLAPWGVSVLILALLGAGVATLLRRRRA